MSRVEKRLFQFKISGYADWNYTGNMYFKYVKINLHFELGRKKKRSNANEISAR